MQFTGGKPPEMKQHIYRLFIKIRNVFSKFVRLFYLRKLQKRLSNRGFSVFSSNCVGGCMLHDLRLPFNSPFVNLFLNTKDYLKYLRDPKKYNALEFQEVESDSGYPVGILGDLTFHFVHYASFTEAVAAFTRRKNRINYDHLFVILSERDGCTYEDLKDFDSLPYKNKVVFTHVPYGDIASAFYIPGFEEEACLGNILKWDRKIGRKIYDHFDFTGWFSESN